MSGLSERLFRSQHENNYGGAVKNLKRVEAELGGATKERPPFVVAALKEHELQFRNSSILHEDYFGNLGGDGKASGAIAARGGDRVDSRRKWRGAGRFAHARRSRKASAMLLNQESNLPSE